MKNSNLLALLGVGIVGYFVYKKINKEKEVSPSKMPDNVKNLINKSNSESNQKSLKIRDYVDSRINRFSDINKKQKTETKESNIDYSLIDSRSQSYEAEKEHLQRGGTPPNYIDNTCHEAWIILAPGESAKFTNDEYLKTDENKNKGNPYTLYNDLKDNKYIAKKIGYSSGVFSVKYTKDSLETLKEAIDLNVKCRLNDWNGDNMITGVNRNKD